jgi:hypothetical protein
VTGADIIRMAREAKVSIRGHYDETGSTPQELERFAKLVAAAEREECAQACDELQQQWRPAGECADAIRARGQS